MTVAFRAAVPFISGSLRAAASVQSCHPGRFRLIRARRRSDRAATPGQTPRGVLRGPFRVRRCRVLRDLPDGAMKR